MTVVSSPWTHPTFTFYYVQKKTDQQSATEVSFITLVNFKFCIIKINYRANHVCTSYDEQHRLYTTIDGNQGRLRYKQWNWTRAVLRCAHASVDGMIFLLKFVIIFFVSLSQVWMRRSNYQSNFQLRYILAELIVVTTQKVIFYNTTFDFPVCSCVLFCCYQKIRKENIN